jgi:HD-GYP domain-containing protein (c-di-GMP phosphodiesterase class II)
MRSPQLPAVHTGAVLAGEQSKTLAAFAVATEPWASLLVLPVLGLIAVFAREREAGIESVLTLRDAYRSTAHLLGEVLATTRGYTGSHSRSVVVIARQVGVSLGVSELVLREIEFGALLRDVGKMAVPNEILNKPAALTDDEMRTVRRHTLGGERMLERIGGMRGEMRPVARRHHERFDGTGYPDGLRARRSRSPRA